MKRNPEKQYIERRMNSIKVKIIRPRFSYRQCQKCGYEYKNEKMYECQYDGAYVQSLKMYAYGCTHCFRSEDDFISFLQSKSILYTEDKLKSIWNTFVLPEDTGYVRRYK